MEVGQVKEAFRSFIAVDREIKRLNEVRKGLISQQAPMRQTIETYLSSQPDPTCALEFEGYLAVLAPKQQVVPGHTKERRVDAAVDYLSRHRDDPRTTLSRIQTLLAGPKEPTTSLRIGPSRNRT
jgi:hypothetical protein